MPATASTIRGLANALLGGLCAAVGAFLIFRPFASLAVLLVTMIVALVLAGIAELARRHWSERRRQRIVRGGALLVAGVVIAVWPGATIILIGLVAGLALVIGGIADLVGGWFASGAARIDGIVGGLASIIFGALAMAWPDVTVLVVAVVFGVQLVVLGIRHVVEGVRQVAGTSEVRPGPPRHHWWRVGRSLVALLVAGLLVAVSSALVSARPVADAFYDRPHGNPGQPGNLLAAEVVTAGVPAGAVAWRILFASSRGDVSSGVVYAPAQAESEPRPLIAWAHGTTGVAQGCAPSVLAKGQEAGALFVLPQMIANGYVVVAPDYVGLGTGGRHPYLIGRPSAEAMLDAIRAARQLKELTLSTETVIWGHSQGGQVALWTGMIASEYAPELTISGVAAMAPASNLPALIDNLAVIPGGSLFASYVITGYSNSYPDVTFDDYVRPGARVIVREAATRCLAEPGILVSLLSSLFLDKPIWSGEPDRGALGARLRENVPTGPIAAPLLIGQGAADSLVLPTAQDAYVAQRCAAGYAVDYRRYAGRDHVPLVEPDSPAISDLFAWTADRFAGKAARNTCP